MVAGTSAPCQNGVYRSPAREGCIMENLVCQNNGSSAFSGCFRKKASVVRQRQGQTRDPDGHCRQEVIASGSIHQRVNNGQGVKQEATWPRSYSVSVLPIVFRVTVTLPAGPQVPEGCTGATRVGSLSDEGHVWPSSSAVCDPQ